MTAARKSKVTQLAVVLLLQLVGHSTFAKIEEDDIVGLDTSKCGVYLAPSSIPGSGLGMYVGHQDIDKGDTVTLGDTIVPIVEFDWHNEGMDWDSFLWDEYTWNSNVFPGMDEEGDDGELIMVASPGVGAAANSYLSLVNVEDTWIKLGRSVRWDSPGTGASSAYYGREFFATKSIPSGAEIFVDYGENYFSSRAETYGYIPLPYSYKLSDRLLAQFLSLKKKLSSKGVSHFSETKKSKKSEDLWDGLYDIVHSQASIWDNKSRVLNGLPEDRKTIQSILNVGGTSQQHLNHSIKDIAWLEENGTCMDNIKPNTSENPDAGRGAFANRFIPKGGVIAPAPLIHIADLNMLRMYEPVDKDSGGVAPDYDGEVTFQLLINYCFGHHESNLLLCPYGLLTAFINHSHEKPNAKIQWSKEMRHPEWKEEKINEWAHEYHTGLSIDFVALRDIQQDEEILIDYGVAWEEAWQKHVAEYEPRENGENYIPAFELNEMTDIEYRTVDDRPYELDGVELWCRGWYLRKVHGELGNDKMCRVLKKLGADDRYMVQIMHHPLDDSDAAQSNTNTGKILWDVPSDALYFGDLPYWRDMHQFNSFRFPMMIPGEMVSDAWKDMAPPVPSVDENE